MNNVYIGTELYWILLTKIQYDLCDVVVKGLFSKELDGELYQNLYRELDTELNFELDDELNEELKNVLV